MSTANHLRRDPESLPWTNTEHAGVARRTLATAVGLQKHDVQLWRIEPGASVPPLAPDVGFEAIVLTGNWQLPEGTLQGGGYARRPPGTTGGDRTESGATLFVRVGAFEANDQDLVHVPTEQRTWQPGQGNLRVQPLHSTGDAGTALVHWPAGERFVPHQHWGGEEVLVLAGTFEDEHGRYPTGTWLLSPHMSAHHPFVTEETIIFVKTGHLPTDAVRCEDRP